MKLTHDLYSKNQCNAGPFFPRKYKYTVWLARYILFSFPNKRQLVQRRDVLICHWHEVGGHQHGEDTPVNTKSKAGGAGDQREPRW